MGNQMTKTFGLVLLAVSAAAFGSACSKSTGDGSGSAALPPEVRSIVFLQRKPRNDAGNVF